MKKILQSGLLLIVTVFSSHAQIYTPSGTVLGTSSNNNVGIGVVPNPVEKLEINGNLKFTNNGSRIFLGTNDYIQFTDANKDGFKFIYDDLERLRITNSGNIGIGTTDPLVLLDVNGFARFRRPSALDTFIQIEVGDVNTVFNGQDSDGWMNYSFNPNNSTRLFINGQSGNVGIGNIDPATKLDVNGIVKISNQGSSMLRLHSDGAPTYGNSIYFATDAGQQQRTARIRSAYNGSTGD